MNAMQVFERGFLALIILSVFACQSPEDGVVPEEDVSTTDDLGVEDVQTPPDIEIQDDLFVEPEVDEDTDPPADMGPQACEPPLSIDGNSIVVATFGYKTLVPSGGTGAYRFEMVTNGSDAIVHPYSGAYLSGSVSETEDLIRVTDEGCIGELDITISVVSDPQVKPNNLQLPPGACFQFAVNGGSGIFVFENLSTKPVGEVNESGFYQAGSKDGYDVIRVTDAETQRITDVIIEILEGAGLESTTLHLLMPLGSRQAVPFKGGSGFFDISMEGSGLEYKDGELIAVSPGNSLVTGADTFLKCQGPDPEVHMAEQVQVSVVSGLEAPTELYGESEPVALLAPGDLNGDGFADLVAGMPYNHNGGLRRGAVFVYSGRSDGIPDVAEQSYTGGTRSGEFGRALAVGDLDGDGNPDLAVGSWLDDNVGNDRGSVRVYKGVEGGFFEEETWLELWGHYGGDRLGAAVSICDVNGDGHLDLLATARRTEDKSQKNVKNDQGGLQIFLGSEEGLPEEADVLRYGVLPDAEGVLIAIKSMEMGMNMTTGDFDGDGLCDVAMSTTLKGGRVLIYSGDKIDGVSLHPVRILGPENDQAWNLGRAMASGDFDGDGDDELVIGQYDYKNDKQNSAGILYMFAGGPLPTEPAAIVEDVAAADWLIAHDGSSDRLGSALAVADINSDGVTDLLAGTYADEVPGGASNTGTINYYLGSEGAFPSTEPYRVVPGAAQDDHLGWALAVIGDLNGDGWAEVAAHARDADDWGKNSGQLYNVWGRPPPIISLGDVWKFSDQGVDHGDAWLAADFDDSEWAEGPGQLGYGDDDEATLLLDADPNIPTAYFRKTIELSSSAAWAELRVIYDDGVGVWVNGKLVFSQYMANGFDFAELASEQSQTDDQVSVVTLGVDSETPFVEGLNTICVMVKQYDAGSSDLSFDLELQTHSDKLALDAETQGLDVLMTTSNSRVGRSVSVLNDVTADGIPDLVMGASLATIGGMGNRAGAAFLYRGTADGFEAQPAHMWNEFSGHHNDSYVGYKVGSADFFGDGQNDVLLVANKLDLNVGYYDDENYSWDTKICKNKGDVGGVFVFSSVPGASLPAQEPSFVYYGHKGNGRIQALASNVDYDGDGYQDLVVSSGEWDYENANNAGGISFVRGRAPGAKSEIVCAPDATFQGPKANVRMGISLTEMGDLDGDGCDEVAVGAYLEDLGVTDQGTVRVFYGWGSNCATAQPRIALLASGAIHSESGFALDGGKDMDGDGLPDLLVGAPDYRVSNQYYGAVFLVPGSYIASLPTVGLNSGSMVPEQAPQPYEQPGSLGNWLRTGPRVNERYGSGVSMVAGLGATGVAAAVAKGGDKNGLLYGGGLDLLEYRNNASKPGLQSKAIAMLSGESYSLGGFLGRVSSGAKSGDSVIMAVGGWRASPMPKNDRSDDGGVYGMLLPQSVVDEAAKGSPGFEEPEGGTDGGTDGGEPAAATWLGGVQAILQAACASCHTIDGKGNTNFASSYTEVISNSLSCAGKTMGECVVIRIENGSMPKGGGPGVNFDDLQLLKEWLAAGMPEK